MKHLNLRRSIFQGNKFGYESMSGALPKTTFYEGQSDRDLFELISSQYLQSSGWIESIQSRRPLRNGSPIPWFTYPAIDFLDSLELDNKTVLEVGGGFSTLYWALRGCSGISLEIDSGWSIAISKALSGISRSNSMAILNVSNTDKYLGVKAENFLGAHQIEQLNSISVERYPEESLSYIENETLIIEHLAKHLSKCDLFIVDGIARNLSLMMAEKYCKKSALIILDNSDRVDYLIGKSFLVLNGWEPTIFTGLGPINPYQWSTTIFRKRAPGY